ncbi:methyltransferase [Dactylosporangium sp. AC04546]|uniref:acetylserotonin O-methyltransferase n=1 Tax=Dactylosporangium sp. AC04546 TaxID=2862460 RepID=UPI001EDF3D2D|nr:acetylserotonin O-methyltransferase [Dactylosporangium sp. AC04546]WVK81323.1 methyltransferase [Dactylosporangium sp. AC04546]
MPIVPSFREGRLTGPRGPQTAFLQEFLSVWGFRAVLAGFRLGVLDALRQEPADSAALAGRLGLDPRGTGFLLDALDVLGYVEAGPGGRYRATGRAAALVDMVGMGLPYFEKIVFTDWQTLEDRLRGESGLPFEVDEPRTPRWLAKEWRLFQDGMVALANLNLDEVLRRVAVAKGDQHLLDIGGGHGLYSIEFCKRHPRLTATVFEIPSMERIARSTIAEHGLAERISFRAGDFFTDDLGSASIILLFNVIHSKSEAQNVKLIERAASATEPGGQVVLLDQFRDRRLGGVGRAFGSFMALSMFNALGQQTYHLDQVAGWFRAAGLTRVRTVPLRSAPGNGLVLGRRR